MTAGGYFSVGTVAGPAHTGVIRSLRTARSVQTSKRAQLVSSYLGLTVSGQPRRSPRNGQGH